MAKQEEVEHWTVRRRKVDLRADSMMVTSGCGKPEETVFWWMLGESWDIVGGFDTKSVAVEAKEVWEMFA